MCTKNQVRVHGFLVSFLMDQSFGRSINSGTLNDILTGIDHAEITQNLFPFVNMAGAYCES